MRPAEPRLAALDGSGSVLSFAVAAEGRAATPAADLRARDIAVVEGGTEFTAVSAALGEQRVRLGVPGRHNVENALAAIGALLGARELDPGLPPIEELVAGLASFPGMARRLERKGEHAGALIFDDYAHHPTEVAASLAALRTLPHRRLIAVFQPHLYSRTQALAARFGRALAGADEIGVLDVYSARERPEGDLAGVSGLQVAQAAADAAPGRRVMWLSDMDRAERELRDDLGPGDVLVTIGAGDVVRLADRLVAAGEGSG